MKKLLLTTAIGLLFLSCKKELVENQGIPSKIRFLNMYWLVPQWDKMRQVSLPFQ